MQIKWSILVKLCDGKSMFMLCTTMAYKNIDDVMHAQRELVEVLHTLRQVVCVKG